jgi:hypothetical protein
MKKVFFVILFFLWVSFSYSLKITEVYFDWSDEFIWIFNETNKQFFWNIIISWAKSSNIKLNNIQINSQQELLVWDDGNMLSWLNLDYSGIKLFVSDTKSINIKLLSWNDLLDKFQVDSDKVKQLNNKKTSFEKIYSGWVWIIQAVHQSINVKTWYIANPWFVKVLSWNINVTWNSQTKKIVQTKVLNCEIKLKNISWEVYNFIYTWNFFLSWNNWLKNNIFVSYWQNLSILINTWNTLIQWVWQDLSWNICTWNYFVSNIQEIIKDNIFTWTLKINEIHPNEDNIFNEYVELKSIWNISWDYIFSWFSSSNHKFSVHLNLYSWNIIVFAKSFSWFKYTWNVILENLSLKDNWENLQILTSGQVIDNVNYIKWNYLYFTKNTWWIRIFSTEWEKTPGYENYVKNYYKTKENIYCSIVKQSEEQLQNQLKINFTSDIPDNKYCSSSYRQIWIYSWWTITWTCNPSFIYLNTWSNNINFQIQNLSWEKLCEDDYYIDYLQQKNITENKQLNCYIKVQSKNDYFLSNSSINFITVVNDKEIQNLNNYYKCSYVLSWQVLSNDCNPSSLVLSWWLHKIVLNVKHDDDKTCQTVYYLNLPSENTKIISHISREIVNPTNCLTMNSTDLQVLVSNIFNKYKSNTTLLKVFNSVKPLFISDKIDVVKKSNSTKLRQFVQEIDNKYKSKITLKKIFQPISYLYNQNKFRSLIKTWGIIITTWEKTNWSIKIVWILPNPIGADKWKEAILLSWEMLSWLYLQYRQKKVNLSNYILSGSNYLFTWTFNFPNTNACIKLFSFWDVLEDKKCYDNVQVWKYIFNFSTWIIENKSLPKK